MNALTARQQEFLTYLRDAMARDGRTPSLREAARDLGVSHMAVSQQVQALEAKGVIKRDRRYGRTLHLMDDALAAGQGAAERARVVPVVGKIAAGLPLYAQQEWDGRIVVDGKRYTAHGLFALRVRGDSMIRDGILDGDLVICEPRQFATNGEIVVALIGGEEATVKRFFLKGERIELRPANDAMAPMLFDLSEVLIQGKVVGLYRGPEGFGL